MKKQSLDINEERVLRVINTKGLEWEDLLKITGFPELKLRRILNKLQRMKFVKHSMEEVKETRNWLIQKEVIPFLNELLRDKNNYREILKSFKGDIKIIEKKIRPIERNIQPLANNVKLFKSDLRLFESDIDVYESDIKLFESAVERRVKLSEDDLELILNDKSLLQSNAELLQSNFAKLISKEENLKNG